MFFYYFENPWYLLLFDNNNVTTVSAYDLSPMASDLLQGLFLDEILILKVPGSSSS